ncbi:MAG: fumarylacetoacetate hydrolase family protein [Bryobacteraceae bacterium]|nr:fumarylacetoacetate hydrolase family protein [Bryobacteraceae bacterium]
MRLGQIRWNNRVTAAIFEDGFARLIPDHTVIDLIQRSEIEGESLATLARTHASSYREQAVPTIPIQPREVWACGCTYEQSAQFRDAEHGTREGFYRYVYERERPEIFFKGTGRVCVGPDKPIGIRSDSRFTAPEPELALILGAKGRILGYTLANDVSAWDIERENPLYLPQSKTFTGCCSLGPVIVTEDELPDPKNLHMTCTISRSGETIFSGEVSTSKICRSLESIIDYLLRSNNVPSGSVLLTGTGIIVTEDSALQPGDVIRISIPEIGELANTAELV